MSWLKKVRHWNKNQHSGHDVTFFCIKETLDTSLNHFGQNTQYSKVK